MESLTAKIASTLRSLRQERGWSLDTTSKKTGISKAMLGQIERSESSPTIATLWKIANGFEVSFSPFLEKSEPTETPLIRRSGNLQQLHPQDDKIRIMPLFAYDKALGFEVFIIELLPGCEHVSSSHHSGVVEHIVVSQGAIEVLIEDTWHSLKENEGIRFNADQAHGYRNITGKKAIFHNMIHYNRT